MPYRTELKRPDLKGTFRCSICQKIFCHSSSLSRHRMQAHFKSYTCTLCHKEITKIPLRTNNMLDLNNNHIESENNSNNVCPKPSPTVTSTVPSHSTPSGSKKPYKELTLEEKVQLIRLAEQNPQLSQAAIAEHYEIAKSNVCRILQRRVEYVTALESEAFGGHRKRKLKPDSVSERQQTRNAVVPVPSMMNDKPFSVSEHDLGNETLRAHMYKQHGISRMFMCRCCNWAFPDKTSLHMHVQSVQGPGGHTGSTGSVNLIAKSGSGPTPNNLLTPVNQMSMPQAPTSTTTVNNSGLAGLSNAANLFPGMQQSRDDLLLKLRERILLNGAMQQQQNATAGLNLAAWLSNFPKVDAFGVGSLGGSLNLSAENTDDNNNNKTNEDDKMGENGHEASSPSNNSFVDVEENGEQNSSSSPTECDSSSKDHQDTNSPTTTSLQQTNEQKQNNEAISMVTNSCNKINGVIDARPQTVPTSGATSTTAASLAANFMPTLRSAIESSPLNSLLYKKKFDDALNARAAALQNAVQNNNNNNAESSAFAVKQEIVPNGRQSLPDFTAANTNATSNTNSVDESVCDRLHISPSDTTGSTSPNQGGTCFDCQLYKGRLALADNRNKFLEGRANNMQQEAQRLKTRVDTLINTNRQLEDESRMLRLQNDNLQRKLLQCQEKVILMMQSNGQNPLLLQQLLAEILQATLIG